MLYELASYARKSGLPAMPGFKTKTATWTLVLSSEGEFVDVVRDERKFRLSPHLEQNELIAGGTTRSHFLLDTVSVVTGETSKKGIKEKKACKEKNEFFISLLEQAGEYEPLLKTCANVLRNESSLMMVREKLKALNAKEEDSVTFRVGAVYPIELDTWHKWWQDFRRTIKQQQQKKDKKKQQKKLSSMVCLLSGETVKPAETHFKISGLTSIGGQSTGTVLIGFDKESFGSYDLPDSLNASCSEEAVAAYRDALDDLIEKAPLPLANTMFLHWYKEPVREEDDLLDFDALLGAEEDDTAARLRVEKLFNSIIDGKRPELTHNMYYILQVSATGGRIMVRDWLTGDFSELVYNLRKWFDDLSLISPFGKGQNKDFKLSAALMRLVSYRPKEKPKDTFKRINDELGPFMPRLWRSIVTGAPLPDYVAAKTLRYIRSRLLASDEEKVERNLDSIACSLLKLWIVRREQSEGGLQMQIGLNEEHLSKAYHVGRLMAILADIQQSALPDVGAGVVQRYYAAASTTPALVIGRLVKLAQYHLDKLDKGLAVWFEKKLADIIMRIGGNIPSTLTLEEQALFALGYYQQKAELMKGKSKSEKNEKNNADK